MFIGLEYRGKATLPAKDIDSYGNVLLQHVLGGRLKIEESPRHSVTATRYLQETFGLDTLNAAAAVQSMEERHFQKLQIDSNYRISSIL